MYTKGNEKGIDDFTTQKNQLNTKGVMDEMRNKKCVRHTENSEMAEVSPLQSVITLHLNGLSSLIKRQIGRIDEDKHDLTMCHLQETHFRSKAQTE